MTGVGVACHAGRAGAACLTTNTDPRPAHEATMIEGMNHFTITAMVIGDAVEWAT